MSLSFKFINYDNIYRNTVSDKILLNEIDIFSTESKEHMDNLIIRNYSEDNLSIIPSCQCKELRGTYYVGEKCRSCNTVVASHIEDNISFLLWLQRPKEIEVFISPYILAVLINRYKITKPNISLIKYILLPNMVIDKRQQKKNLHLLERLEFLLATNNIKRGYNSFIQNFFTIIGILESEFSKAKEEDKIEFQEFLLLNKDNLFSNYLPFPNRIIFAMDSNELGKFIDKSLLNPINVVRRVTGIDLYTKPSNIKQRKIATSLIDLAEFYSSYMKSTFFAKLGLIRQHISSSRLHFTARAVVSSILGPHDYDEIHLPWSLSCTLFRMHILNRLYARNYTYRQAINLLSTHNRTYHPVLDEIFKEIIAYTGTGIQVFFNRNPSLHRGSIQTVRVTRIKTDVHDNTFSMSYLIAKALNLDYDGDCGNLMLPLTQKILRNMNNFDPHHNVLGLSGVNEFSGNIGLPKTVVSTLSNWYSG